MTADPNLTDPKLTDPASKANQPKRTRWGWIFGILVLCVLSWLFWRPSPTPVISEDNPNTPVLVHEPVHYNVDAWAMASMGNLATAKTRLGATGITAEGLDIQGNHAKITRLAGNYEPPLALIESDHFIELVWYYAPDVDTQQNKDTSLAHAKKAHAFFTTLLGKAGHTLIEQLLNDKDGHGSDDGDKAATLPPNVRLANCQDYECRVVIIKP